VFAEAGAPQLRGLDLSAAAVVQQARAATDAVIGSWIVAGKLLDLSVSPVRLGEATMGLLVVGETVGAEQLAAVSKGTAVDVALVLGDKIGETPSRLDAALWSRLAAESTPFPARLLERDGQRYLVGLAELPNAGGPLQARLATARRAVALAGACVAAAGGAVVRRRVARALTLAPLCWAAAATAQPMRDRAEVAPEGSDEASPDRAAALDGDADRDGPDVVELQQRVEALEALLETEVQSRRARVPVKVSGYGDRPRAVPAAR
jgi:hypothetical protein